MKRSILRKNLLRILLLFLILELFYHYAFYLPLQAEQEAVSSQAQILDTRITEHATKAAQLDAMQHALEKLLSSEENTSEIAPYDNESQVLRFLNTVLRHGEEYSLQFSDPVIASDGSVRRCVTLTVRCSDFASAKAILSEFDNSPFRCVINSLSLSASGNILADPLQLQATVTFLESTKLTP